MHIRLVGKSRTAFMFELFSLTRGINIDKIVCIMCSECHCHLEPTYMLSDKIQ